MPETQPPRQELMPSIVQELLISKSLIFMSKCQTFYKKTCYMWRNSQTLSIVAGKDRERSLWGEVEHLAGSRWFKQVDQYTTGYVR